MFLFIVYGVGPRHCQNVGCSKSTAKAQLRDTPSVKLSDVKVGKPVQPLPCSAAATFLPVTLGSCWPCLWLSVVPQQRKASHLTHTSLPGGQLSSAPSVPWEQSAQDLQGTSCSPKKMGQNTILTQPPDSSLSPRISLQQQFSLCTSTSWLQTVLRSRTKHNPKSSSVLTLGKVTS